MTEAQISRPRTRRQTAPMVLGAAGPILLLVATFLPWYRVGPGHVSRSAWQESPLVLVLLLAVVVAGGAVAYAAARGHLLPERTSTALFALTLAATLVVVFRLFFVRPGGNAATTLAFGGYPALLAINLVKTSAVVSLGLARRRRSATFQAAGQPPHTIPAERQ